MAAGYHDFVAAEVLTAANLEDYCELQGIMRFASAAARDSALAAVLTEGLFAYLIDLNVITVYTGSAWSTIGPVHGANTTWTPVVVQGATPTLTNDRGVYMRTGRRVLSDGYLSLTSSGTAANLVTLSLPVQAASSNANTILGWGFIYDASVTNAYMGFWVPASATTAKLQMVGVGGVSVAYAGTSTFTAALASADLVSYNFNYEASGDA